MRYCKAYTNLSDIKPYKYSHLVQIDIDMRVVALPIYTKRVLYKGNDNFTEFLNHVGQNGDSLYILRRYCYIVVSILPRKTMVGSIHSIWRM